jgi:hypothetical protein
MMLLMRAQGNSYTQIENDIGEQKPNKTFLAGQFVAAEPTELLHEGCKEGRLLRLGTARQSDQRQRKGEQINTSRRR